MKTIILVGSCLNLRIKKLFFNNQPSRYDINVMEHQHFCCEKCNKIIDLEDTEDVSM